MFEKYIFINLNNRFLIQNDYSGIKINIPFLPSVTNNNVENVLFHWKTVSFGACIIKLITAVIYGFRNKLECLSLASLSSLV
jgi:hypothetical protein